MVETQQPPKPKQHFSMLRSFVPADFITLANASCGTTAIFMCLTYLDTAQRLYLWIAFGLLPLALLFDAADGYVARHHHRRSRLGTDLDSLADIVSFGVAPAVMGYTLGMRGPLDVLLLVFFVTCGISRLARYNVTAEVLTGKSGKVAFYEGTPIPSSLLLVLVLALAAASGGIHDSLWLGRLSLAGLGLHPLALMYAVSGSAMISTVRIPKP